MASTRPSSSEQRRPNGSVFGKGRTLRQVSLIAVAITLILSQIFFLVVSLLHVQHQSRSKATVGTNSRGVSPPIHDRDAAATRANDRQVRNANVAKQHGSTQAGVGPYGSSALEASADVVAMRKLLSSPDGVIYGNPMENPVCQNSLLDAHRFDKRRVIDSYHERLAGLDDDEKPSNLPPSFWSRESLAAMRAPLGRHELDIHCSMLVNWGRHHRLSDTRNNATRGAYILLGKCGSSSIRSMLERQQVRKGTPLRRIPSQNRPGRKRDALAVVDTNCTFTFVRDPLTRLISAYFTVNAFLLSRKRKVEAGETRNGRDNHFGDVVRTWSFWNVTSEPARFRAFAQDMIERTNEFVTWPPLEHVYTLAGNLSPFFGSRINFIGRTEQFEHHWKLLQQREACSEFVGRSNEEEPLVHMLKLGQINRDLSNPELNSWLGLEGIDLTSGNKLDLPQYKEVVRDQNFFNQLVEHFWQDYVCFGYEPNYPELGIGYTGSFKKPY